VANGLIHSNHAHILTSIQLHKLTMEVATNSLTRSWERKSTIWPRGFAHQ